MSLFSRLVSAFTGAASPQATSDQTSDKTNVPGVKKSVVQEAVTDQHSVRLPEATTSVAPGMVCDYLDGAGSRIKTLPDDITIRFRLRLTNCKDLTDLPDGLTIPSVDLSGCTALQQLPGGMQVTFLKLDDCDALKQLPDNLRIQGGILSLQNCTGLTRLPDNLGEVAGLDLNGCSGITKLPAGLKVTSWIDITGTGIGTLPDGYAHVGFRRGNDVISADAALAG
ncbi:hypothetical protein [Halovulum sp. GXIMD14793]